MASITTPSSTALATDVIAVIGPNGMYSTDFYVKFSTSLYKPSSLEGLGLDQPHSDSGNNHVNNDNTDTTKDRAGSDDMAPSNERKGNDSEERLQLLKLGPEWVDIYCNDILCKDVSAVIGIKGLLFFVEDKKLSLVPSERILLSMNLECGRNEVKCVHRNSNQTATFELCLYQSSDSLIVTDIDGTITISDVRGYLETVYLGYYSYIHEGIVSFLDYLVQRHGYHVIFLTSRPITHKAETRNFLRQARDGSLHIPQGPLFTNRASTVEAAYSELIAKSAKVLKSNQLLKIVDVFTAAGRDRRLNPMIIGIGNRQSDALAYNIAGLAPQSILLIDQSSTVRIWEGPPPSHLPSINFIRSTTNSSEYSSEYGSLVPSTSSSGRESPSLNITTSDGLTNVDELSHTPIAKENDIATSLLCVTEPVSTAFTRVASMGPISDIITMNDTISEVSTAPSSPTRDRAKFSPKFSPDGQLDTKLSRTSSMLQSAMKEEPTYDENPAHQHGQIMSFVDDDGVTHSAIFSSYRDASLWRYADLLAVHHDKRYYEIQRIIHEEMMLNEALEAANEVNAHLKSASVNLQFMEALHLSSGGSIKDRNALSKSYSSDASD